MAEQIDHKENESRQKRDRAATEAKLLVAAESVFSRFGFRSATTKVIAQTAGANEALIGRYFNGKDGLLFALLKRRMHECMHEALPYAEEKSLAREMNAYVKFRFENYVQSLDFFKIVITQFLVDEKFGRKMRELAPPSFNAELEKRVLRLLDAPTRAQKARLHQKLEQLEVQIFGTVIMKTVILAESDQLVLKNLISFTSDITHNL